MLQRQFSAGGVVFKRKNNQVRWLVAKSAPSNDYPESKWRLPKGWLDDEANNPGPLARGERKATEEELKEAARREVREEGGVESIVLKKITTTSFFLTGKGGNRILKFVTYYLMEWVRDLPEGFGFETSEIKWLPQKEARKILSISGEKKILDKANQILNSGI